MSKTAIEELRYLVDNPSAWECYDDSVSAKIAAALSALHAKAGVSVNWNNADDPAVKLFVGFDVEGYVEEYELCGDEGYYSPNEQEKVLLVDAIYGVVSNLHEELRKIIPSTTSALSTKLQEPVGELVVPDCGRIPDLQLNEGDIVERVSEHDPYTISDIGSLYKFTSESLYHKGQHLVRTQANTGWTSIGDKGTFKIVSRNGSPTLAHQPVTAGLAKKLAGQINDTEYVLGRWEKKGPTSLTLVVRNLLAALKSEGRIDG